MMMSLGKPVWCVGRLLFTLHRVIKDGCYVAFSCRSERASQRSKRTLLPGDKASTTDSSFVGPSKGIGAFQILARVPGTGSEGFEIETSLLEAEHKKETMTVVRTEGCVAVNGAGIAYREFSCEYPQLEPLYLQAEKDYDPIYVLNWMRDHPMVPVFACVAYGVLIVLGQHVMSKRPAWDWRRAMAFWNLSLSVFSGIGMLRTAPQLAHNLYTMSIRDNLCLDPRSTYGSGSTGLWVQLFILSKFPELIDTFFIVIHKKPLIFLHWYHHITVLLYCWHSYVTTSPPGIFFVVMNYSVHATMYGYYFLMAMKLRPKWFNPMIITGFQISQMVVGVIVTLLGFYYFNTDPECRIEKENNTAAFVMYGSYLFLFLQFFVGRYFAPKKKQKTV